MASETAYSKGKAVFWVAFTVVAVLLLDQILKIYIKTNFTLGEEVSVMGSWFKLHFTENPGMAFGIIPFGGSTGKILLTSFRLVASIVIVFYLRNLIREKAKMGLVILVGLILAGALGNILDSLFYGMLFSESTYHQVAVWMPDGGGYEGIFMGRVVDMLYFPLVDTYLADWVPFIGGERFQFFRPVFNIADSAISIGVFTIIAFRKRLFAIPEEDVPQPESVVEEEPGTAEPLTPPSESTDTNQNTEESDSGLDQEAV